MEWNIGLKMITLHQCVTFKIICPFAIWAIIYYNLPMNDSDKIAILIDADNTQLQKLDAIMTEISTRGRIVVKRAYGNWKKRTLNKWENELKRLGIKAEQQFDYVTGKNATDMALVIDAMDLLSSNRFDSFVIVSSDSDFTPLAIRLHESGANIIGIGVQTTPQSFRNACDDFLFLENLTTVDTPDAQDLEHTVAKTQRHSSAKHQNQGSNTQQTQAIAQPQASTTAQGTSPAIPQTTTQAPARKQKVTKDIHNLIHKAFETYQDNDGLADVSAAGSYIKRAKPDFDTRTYGHPKLSNLLEAFPTRYQVIRTPNKNNGTSIYFRCLDE